MLRKFFAYGSIIGCLIALSQCCIKPVEDVTGQALRWEGPEVWEQGIPHADFSQGITCYVPSEETVYFLSAKGACWQFMQTSEEGGLHLASIQDVPNVSDKPFFPFPAGSGAAQKLYVGSIDVVHNRVTIQQYNGNTWESAGSYPLAEAANFAGTACGLHNEAADGLNGLIILAHKNESTKSKVLIYDAEEQSFKESGEWAYQSNVSPKAAVQIAPTTILISRLADPSNPYLEPIVKILRNTDSRPYVVHKGVKPTMLSLFVLQPSPYVKRAVWAMKEDSNGQLRFHTLEYSGPESADDLPEETDDHKQSWILPFSDAVYVVVRDENGSLVYYRGSLEKSDN